MENVNLRIGIVLPSTNTSAQPEMEAMRPYGVTNHVARMIIDDDLLTETPGFNRVIQAMRSSTLPAIDSLKHCRIDRLILAVSPDAYWQGVGAHQQLLSDLLSSAGNSAITTSADAIEQALSRLGNKRRIGLISPYTSVGDSAVSRFFTDKGYDVVSLAHLKGRSPSGISEMTRDDLKSAVERANAADAEVIVQVGTNAPMARFADAAEQWIGKPVIANNTALYWHALRASGISHHCEGFGHLLRFL